MYLVFAVKNGILHMNGITAISNTYNDGIWNDVLFLDCSTRQLVINLKRNDLLSACTTFRMS